MSQSIAAPVPVAQPFRLPWPAMAATLIACAALFEREGGSFVLPVLAAVMLASWFVPYRMGNRIGEFGPWLIALILPVLLQNFLRVQSENPGLFDPSRARYSGEGAAAVLAMECWRKRPDGGGRGVIAILLSAFILMAGTSAYDEQHIPILVPAYAFFLILALRAFRSPTEPVESEPVRPALRALRIGTLAAALAVGVAGYLAFHTYRSEITDWGMRMLHERPTRPSDGTGLSNVPQLGATHGDPGALTRVLRITGDLEQPHLRGLAFSNYMRGRWGPARDDRTYSDAGPSVLKAASAVPIDRIRVTRLTDADGVLVMPLNTAGLSLEEQSGVGWDEEDGGPIRSKTPAPSDYCVQVAKDEAYQGPLCGPPTGRYLARLTEVPPDIGPGVRDLAARIVRGARSPLEEAGAIETYLMRAHHYSLRFDPGPGDPVTSFLTGNRGAHCEYFAAGSAILLRCAGIPARYVVGYYAHEGAGSGTVVVRQRDAHAWTEAWIAGTGWITIDATPADGLPDRTGAEPPAWMRASEWLQDRWAALVIGLSATDPRVMAGLLAGLVCIWIGSSLLKRRRRARNGPRAFAYSDPGGAARDLRARFEAICRARGWELPPDRPWSDTLGEMAALAGAEWVPEYVRVYNSVRFGSAGSEATDRLRALLARHGA